MSENNDRTHKKQLMMLRTQSSLPEVRLPEGWSVRPMRADEHGAWAAIAGAAGFGPLPGETPEAHWQRMMGSDPGVKEENVFFAATAEGRAVATAAARLFEDSSRTRRGCLHYVAALPESRGRGAGTAVVAAVLRRFAELGMETCALTTDDFRLSAIGIYLRMGWLPVLHAADMRPRWEKVLSELHWHGELAAYDENCVPTDPLRAG